MIKKIFEINFKNESIDFSSEFYLSDKIENFVIAEDLSGNKIVSKKSCVYLYIHDAPEQYEYIKIFESLKEFYSNIEFYDEIEQNRRHKKIIENNNIDENDITQEKMVLISTFISKLGSKRLNKKYKEGSYYNISKAFVDGEITPEEFEIFRFLPE
jgi:hypothetical protein